MKDFFPQDLLLTTPAAREMYAVVKDLPIIDYHCHLAEAHIAENRRFDSLGELWLACDHYKWRAMRLCGVDEYYITGDASYDEKFYKYAEIFPQLGGNALYYWGQMELAMLFDIHEPLDATTAPSILARANEKLATMRVRDLLNQFGVAYLATTDDPVSPLAHHGTYDNTRVSPTFRPDRMVALDETTLAELAEAAGMATDTLDGLKAALESRLDFFCSKGCGIADHGMDFLPVADCGAETAAALYARRGDLTPAEKEQLSSHLIYFIASLYARRGMVMQLHFATYRNVNTNQFATVGRDAGYDVMRGSVDTDRLVEFLNTLHTRGDLPATVLYSLNPACVPALCTLSGAFPGVRVGAAWWFNDTVEGIRRQIEVIAEYAVLGSNLGMLTDSRSFAGYVRFDFFRRILADVVGGWVEKGEYHPDHAKKLMYDVCYGNIHSLLKL